MSVQLEGGGEMVVSAAPDARTADGYIYLFEIEPASGMPAVRVNIGQGIARDSTDVFTLINDGADIMLDLTVSGAGGLDTGVEAANTWYYVYVIGDTTRVNPIDGVFSADQMNPTLPAGYDVFRRVGVVRNDAASDIIDFQNFGHNADRVTRYRSERSTRQVLAAGAASGVNPTAVNLTNFVPPTSRNAQIEALEMGTQPLELYRQGGGGTNPMLYQIEAGDQAVIAFYATNNGQNIGYNHPAAGGLADIYVSGFAESL